MHPAPIALAFQSRALRALGAAAAIGCASFTPPLHAQSGKLGTYAGTATVSFSELGKETRADYRGVVTIAIPITSRNSSSAMAEISDIDKPSATARITHLESSWKGTVPESDGKTSSWSCKLAAPTEVPMNAQGTLNVDYKRKTHSLFIALVSTRPVPLNCVNSRSGPYKKQEMVSLFLATNEPGDAWKELPFTDPARLAAKFTMMPGAQMKGRYSPIEQEWDFRLQR
jgi:hypothetical protein